MDTTGPGGGYIFDDKISGGRIPKEYIPSVDHGIREAMSNGVLAGYPTVDIKVELVDGKYHDVDSSEMAFKIAGIQVFKEAARKAKPVLLEPIMAVEVVTPDDYMGDVIGDLNSRRGKVGKMEQRGNNQVITAEVPLSEMFGYATDVRSKTQGRATYSMQFASYQQTPAQRSGRDRRPGHRSVIRQRRPSLTRGARRRITPTNSESSRRRKGTRWPRRSSSGTSLT